MVNWNPNFPDILGLEWLMSHGRISRVWSGAPGRLMRLPSTSANTIKKLRLSATIDTDLEADTRTLIDIYDEEDVANGMDTFRFRSLVPSADIEANGWTTQSGSGSNLFETIQRSAGQWPLAESNAATWIQNTVGNQNYAFNVDATGFAATGDFENARIGFVEVRAILGANTGFRKMSHFMRIDGENYDPAGGRIRDVHGFGAIYTFWYGEINPATEKPWLPSDIAEFSAGGHSRLILRALAATPDKFPIVYAVRLRVYLVDEENRKAVGVWRRPIESSVNIGGIQNIETDDLISLPDGTEGWEKEDGRNYVFAWRQSVAPSLYGPINAADVRWNGALQNLGPDGEPPGPVYPLHDSGRPRPPDDIMASNRSAYDRFGRFEEGFTGVSRHGYGIALLGDSDVPDDDSQPYRLTLRELILLNDTFTVGQRVSMVGAESYLGVRLPAIPPARPGSTRDDTSTVAPNSTLTVTVHRVSGDVQMGGEFTINVAQARRIEPAGQDVRYVAGFLTSAANLVNGVDYEIRVSTDAPPEFPWILFMPDSSLAPETGFGGNLIGAMIDDTQHLDRSLSVNITRRPDAPGSFAATHHPVPIASVAGGVTEIDHVRLSWTSTTLGASFRMYQIARRLNDGEWRRIANLDDEALTEFVDHECPRSTSADYRIRAVGLHGESTAFTNDSIDPIESPGALLILTSNHAPDDELVFLYDVESSYPILSNEGDEVVRIHGSDRQVVFVENEDRGIGWTTRIAVSQVVIQEQGGVHVFTPLVEYLRTMDKPYVCVMDEKGTQLLGHVTVSDASQTQPAHMYIAQVDVIPTHTDPVPVLIIGE